MVKVVIDSSVLIQNIRLGREVFFELVEAVKQKKSGGVGTDSGVNGNLVGKIDE